MDEATKWIESKFLITGTKRAKLYSKAQMNEAYDAGVAAERERCAKKAEAERERIKHTSHVDGLGMGDQRREQTCDTIAAAIRGGEEGSESIEKGRKSFDDFDAALANLNKYES
jgi:hypothetical protein